MREYNPNRRDFLEVISSEPEGPEEDVQLTPWTVHSGARGARTWHVQRRRTWTQDGWRRSRVEQLSGPSGRQRTFASMAVAQRAADEAGASGYRPNEDLAWREVYGREYRAAEDRGLESWRAREVAAKAAWADYESRTGQPALLRNGTRREPAPALPTCPECLYEQRTGKVAPIDHSCETDVEQYARVGHQSNGEPPEGERERISLGLRPECPLCGHGNWTYELRPGLFTCQRHRETAIERPVGFLRRDSAHQSNGVSYYVWALARGSDAPIDEGPWGPYDNLTSAKTFARIGATEGAHDRAVSMGLNPQSPSFEIVRRYEARTGERLL